MYIKQKEKHVADQSQPKVYSRKLLHESKTSLFADSGETWSYLICYMPAEVLQPPLAGVNLLNTLKDQ